MVLKPSVDGLRPAPRPGVRGQGVDQTPRNFRSHHVLGLGQRLDGRPYDGGRIFLHNFRLHLSQLYRQHAYPPHLYHQQRLPPCQHRPQDTFLPYQLCRQDPPPLYQLRLELLQELMVPQEDL